MVTEALKRKLPESFDGYDLESSTASAEQSNEAAAVYAFNTARQLNTPFKHWLFHGAIPIPLCHEVINLPIEAYEVEDNKGKRDSLNDVRRFLNPEMQAKFPVMREITRMFQSAPVVHSLEKLCGVSFNGGFLRIEYCQDRGNFWLEPHMDIKEKLITIQIYLNTGVDAESIGTDLYDSNKQYVSSSPSSLGQGMIFVPSEPNSYHGFEKRKLADVRRSLLINYVKGDWRSVHELAFPHEPISS